MSLWGPVWIRKTGKESERCCDVDEMSFGCSSSFTARTRRQRLILSSPVLQNGVAGVTLKAKLPINEPIICVIM